MSIKTSLQQSGTQSKHSNPIGSPPARSVPTPWVRNPSWSAMPTVLPTEQKLVALFAVYPGGSSAAFTISGAYTVDWGDGTTQNFNAGVTASRDYDYAASALANTNAPVTFTASTSTVNRTAHGYTNGMQVQFWDIVTTTGIAQGALYYVINATANTFQIASSPTSTTPVTLTGDGSATLLPYKQAIITITPQAANSLTSISLNVLPTSKTGITSWVTNHLDVIVSGTSIATLSLSGSTSTQRMLERAQLISNNLIASFSNMFFGCSSLQSVPTWIIRNDAAISTSSMFNGCSTLTYGPDLDLSRSTSTSSMFNGCSNLVGIPRYNTSNVTTMNSMFQGCTALKSIPLLSTSLSVTMASFFSGCSNLSEVPALDISSSTSNNSMFASCYSLTYIPSLKTNTTSNWSANTMFQTCTALKGFGAFDTSKLSDATSMFANCYSLASVPWSSINLPVVTTVSNMFSTCLSLNTLPDITIANTTLSAMNSMFGGCSSLVSIGKITLASTSTAFSFSSTFTSCTSLTNVTISAPSVTAGTMSNMFQSCNVLQTVYWDFATNVTNGNNIFSNCIALISHPVITFATGGSYNTPYVNCYNLRYGGFRGYTTSINIGPVMVSPDYLTTNYLNGCGAGNGITLNLTNNPGSGVQIISVTTTAGSTTVACPNASLLTAGQSVGNGQNSGGNPQISVASTISTSLFTYNDHGLANGTRVGFTNIRTTTGVSTYTVYYVVNATTNTFQLSATSGGSAITLGGTAASNMTMTYELKIVSISGTNLTMNAPARTSGTANWSFHACDVSTPLIRGWTITG